MRVCKFYNLKDGTETCVMCEERNIKAGSQIKTGKEKNKNRIMNISFKTVKMFFKAIIPTFIGLVIYLLVAERLYRIRGYHGIGSEIFLPIPVQYLGYIIINSLF